MRCLDRGLLFQNPGYTAAGFPNGLHVVVSGARGVRGAGVEAVRRALQEASNVEGLDLAPLDALRLPAFAVDV